MPKTGVVAAWRLEAPATGRLHRPVTYPLSFSYGGLLSIGYSCAWRRDLMPHENLRPYVGDVAELYETLQRDQTSLERQLGWQPWGLLVLMVVGLAMAGPMGKAAICMAVLLGMSWAKGTVELICRNWFMHALTLGDLVPVPADATASVLTALWRIESLTEAAGEGPERGAEGEGEQHAAH